MGSEIESGSDTESRGCCRLRAVALNTDSQTESEGDAESPSHDSKAVLVDDAIECIGMGWGQYRLILLTGLFLAADASEVSYLSYVTVVLRQDWNLAASSESLVVSMVFWGQIVGSPVWGVLADRIGRRPSFLAASVLVLCAGLLTAASDSVAMLVATRAAVGFGVAGLSVPYDVLAESLPSESRGFWLMAIMFFQTVGSLYTTFVAWAVLEKYGWQVFTLLEGIPALCGTLLAFLIFPESAHWLAEEGKHEEAAEVVNTFAYQNGSDQRFVSLKPPAPEESKPGDKYLRKAAVIRPLVLMAIVWFGFGAAFYGIQFMLPHLFSKDSSSASGENSMQSNSSSNLYGSNSSHPDSHPDSGVTFDFVKIAIVNFAQALGLLLGMVAVDRTGRKQVQFVGYGVAGLASIALGFKSLGFEFLTGVSSLASCAEMAASCATWVHTAELFPTSVRATAHAVLNATSRIGGALAPYIISDALPASATALIISACSLAAAFAVCPLKETAGHKLEDNSDAALAREADLAACVGLSSVDAD